MTDITFKCVKCGEEVGANAADAGKEGECPTCKASMIIPSLPRNSAKPPVLPQTPPPVPKRTPMRPAVPQAQARASSIITAGWICFGVAIAISPLIITVPLCVALFGAAAILSVIAIVKGRTGAGIGLLISSLVVPPMLFFVIFTAAVASIFSAATGSVLKPPPVRQAAVIVPPAQESIRQVLPLGQFLSQMEESARPYRDAQTSVRKEEARRIALGTAQRLLDRTELTFSAVVSDVQVIRDGVARISFKSPDLASATFPASGALWVSSTSYLDLSLSRDQALAITPGTGMSIAGRAVFSEAIGQTPAFLTLQLSRDMKPLGMVYLPTVRCQLVQATPTKRP